jgi:hypothetical protein
METSEGLSIVGGWTEDGRRKTEDGETWKRPKDFPSSNK